VPSWAEWDRVHLAEHRFVVVDDGRVLGWAALSPVSARRAYTGVVECSIYVSEHARGRGVGRALLEALVGSSERAGIWTIQAGIFPENVTSVRLHECAGFRVVGRRERLGRLDGVWRDVLLLERRSPLVD
jgi:L-amino acid N-acyltransferase YncA